MKKIKPPSIIVIAILTLATALVWVTSDLVRSLTKKPEVIVPEEVLSDLTPTLDREALEQIQAALYFNDSQIIEQANVPEQEPADTIDQPVEVEETPLPVPQIEPEVEIPTDSGTSGATQ